MQASSLQLESSAIIRLHIEANKSFPQERAGDRFTQFAEAGLESSVDVAPDKSDERRYFVKLSISLPGTPEAPAPYILDLEMLGAFECTGSDPEKFQRMAEINAPAVLYGSIRELVMQICSRGPFPPLVLPTVNFLPPNLQVELDGRPCKEQ